MSKISTYLIFIHHASLQVCAHVYMHTCQVNTYTSCTCSQIRCIHIYGHVNMCVCIYIYTCICRLRAYVMYTYICTREYVCVYIHIYVYMYTHMYMCMYICQYDIFILPPQPTSAKEIHIIKLFCPKKSPSCSNTHEIGFFCHTGPHPDF